MAGLMQQQAPVEDPMAGGGQEQASPEEQAQYEQFVTNGMQLLYDENTMESVLESIRGDGNPVEGAANALVMVVMRLEDSAAESGQEISGDVKLHAAGELLEQIVELTEAAGAHKFTDEEIESALLMAMDLYRDNRQGMLPEDELQQDFSDLMAADQAGQIESVAPGLTEYANRAQRPQGATEEPSGLMPQRG